MNRQRIGVDQDRYYRPIENRLDVLSGSMIDGATRARKSNGRSLRLDDHSFLFDEPSERSRDPLGAGPDVEQRDFTMRLLTV